MPLTAKGEKIEGAMEKEYGTKKGKEVFYASRNSGRITGVDSVVASAAELQARIAKADAEAFQMEGQTYKSAISKLRRSAETTMNGAGRKPESGRARALPNEWSVKSARIQNRQADYLESVQDSGKFVTKEDVNKMLTMRSDAALTPDDAKALGARMDVMAEGVHNMFKRIDAMKADSRTVTQRMDSSAPANEMERKAMEHRALGKGRDQSAHMRAFKDYMSAAKFYERAENSKDTKEKTSWMDWGDKAKMAAERSSSNAYRDEPNGYVPVKTPQASWGDDAVASRVDGSASYEARDDAMTAGQSFKQIYRELERGYNGWQKQMSKPGGMMWAKNANNFAQAMRWVVEKGIEGKATEADIVVINSLLRAQ